jgi:AraC family transcriptional regulator of arabinose operon
LARLLMTSQPTYWRCEPGWSWHARPLPDHLLWYILDGVGELMLDGRHHDLTPGTCVVFAPGDAPVADHDPHRRLLVFGLHFTPERPEDVLPGQCVQIRDQVLLGALARRCETSYRRGDPLGRGQSLLCLEQILGLVREDATSPAPGRIDTALDDIIQVIRRDPSRRWTVTELASRVALSRSQFTRRFLAHTGLSPARYLINARLDRARQLLTETNMSVTQVAVTLGYTDVAYFSRQYRRHTGRTPGHARRHDDVGPTMLPAVPASQLDGEGRAGRDA